MDGTWPLCGQLVFAATLFGFLGLLTRLRQPVKRALDAGDQAGCDPRVARRRIQFVVTQQCLDDSDISVVFEQVGREAVPCSVTFFLIPAASAVSWNRRLNWRVVIGLPGLRPGNNQRSSSGTPVSQRVGRTFHHCRNRSSILGDSITFRSLRPLDCSMRIILCALSICLTFNRTTSLARRPPP